MAKERNKFRLDSNHLAAPYEIYPGIRAINGEYYHRQTANGLLIGNECLIDPGSLDHYPHLIQNLRKTTAPEDFGRINPLKSIRLILLTHPHVDHYSCLPQLLSDIREAGGNPRIYIPKNSGEIFASTGHFLNARYMYPNSSAPPLRDPQVIEIEPNETIESGRFLITPIDTSGHAPFHYSYLIQNSENTDRLVCLGDALGGVYDLRLGSNFELYRETYDLLASINCNAFFEGHGFPTHPISKDEILKRRENLANSLREASPHPLGGLQLQY